MWTSSWNCKQTADKYKQTAGNCKQTADNCKQIADKCKQTADKKVNKQLTVANNSWHM